MASEARRVALTREYELLQRILRVSRLQHGRALYYHRLSAVRKALGAALDCCSESSLATTGGSAVALAAIERVLHAIPAPWLRLRHLMAQTYFMTFALSCLALLSRAASLLAEMHAELGGHASEPMEAAGVAGYLPSLLALARPHGSSAAVLSQIFGGANAGGGVAVASAARPPPGAGPSVSESDSGRNREGDGLGNDVNDDDVGEPVEPAPEAAVHLQQPADQQHSTADNGDGDGDGDDDDDDGLLFSIDTRPDTSMISGAQEGTAGAGGLSTVNIETDVADAESSSAVSAMLPSIGAKSARARDAPSSAIRPASAEPPELMAAFMADDSTSEPVTCSQALPPTLTGQRQNSSSAATRTRTRGTLRPTPYLQLMARGSLLRSYLLRSKRRGPDLS